MINKQDEWFNTTITEAKKFTEELVESKIAQTKANAINQEHTSKQFYKKLFNEMQQSHLKELEKAYQEAETWKASHKTMKKKFDVQLTINKELQKKLDKALASAANEVSI